MKRVSIIIILLSVCILSSCSNDDDFQYDQLTGRWNFVSYSGTWSLSDRDGNVLYSYEMEGDNYDLELTVNDTLFMFKGTYDTREYNSEDSDVTVYNHDFTRPKILSYSPNVRVFNTSINLSRFNNFISTYKSTVTIKDVTENKLVLEQTYYSPSVQVSDVYGYITIPQSIEGRSKFEYTKVID